MPFAPLHELLPSVAREETRSVRIPPTGEDPGEELSFLELYCDEAGCDCRRVVFQVVSDRDRHGVLAHISFGWEPSSFYRNWASFPLSAEDIEELKGPALMRLSVQSDRAADMVDYCRLLVADTAYVERIVRHYGMFRERVGARAKPRRLYSGWRSPSKKRR